MADYTVRRATLDDLNALVSHRIRMFEDMGVLTVPGLDAERLDAAFRAWLIEVLPAGTCVAWVVETTGADGPAEIVAGGGATLIPWPPGPRYPGNRLAFVYNVYTDPAHRRRGLARLVMKAIHAWCREAGITSMALNASRDGQPLYKAMGYAESPSPMMFLPINRV